MRYRLTVCFSLLAVLLPASSGDADLRIVGGETARPGQWKAIGALVERKGAPDQSQFCAGTLIAPRWVLTAGHCLAEISARDTDIIFARGDLRFSGGERRAVVKEFLYPGFRQRSARFDYGLVYLNRPVRKYRPLELARSAPRPGQKLHIAGWGTTRFRGEPSPTLLQGTVNAQRPESCQKSYRKLFLREAMFCAAQDGVDSCSGDSGGPAVDHSGQIIYGIVSQGRGCGNERYPGIYSVVSRASRWIGNRLEQGPGQFRPRREGLDRRYWPFRDHAYGSIWSGGAVGGYRFGFYLYPRDRISGAAIRIIGDSTVCDTGNVCGKEFALQSIGGPGPSDWAFFGSTEQKCLELSWTARFAEPRIGTRSGRIRFCPER